MAKLFVFSVLCFLNLYVQIACCLYCWVDSNYDFSDQQPLLLQANSNEFLYPSRKFSNSLKFRLCESVRVACPQDDSLQVFSSKLNVSQATINCLGFSFFHVSGTGFSAPLRRIECARGSLAVANVTGANCYNGNLGHIGFPLSASLFLPTVDQICHNETLGQTHWVHSRVHLAVRQRQKERQAPGFRTGPYYVNISMGPELFTREAQRARLALLLGDSALADTYIPMAGGDYLIETLLASPADMFYRPEQESAYFYVNTVPAWRSVRDGNWRLVELLVRKLAGGKRPANLDLWTGGIGVLALDDLDGNTTEITLTTDRDSNAVLPVPKFLFKYVVDQVADRGIVFITLNNPHVTAITTGEILCQGRITCPNLYPQFKVATLGYTYCCAIDSTSKFHAIAASFGLPTFPTAKPLI